MPRSKVHVNTSAVADHYSDEKIIEISSPGGGCLIAFRLMDDDTTLRIDVYRADDTVTVTGPTV